MNRQRFGRLVAALGVLMLSSSVEAQTRNATWQQPAELVADTAAQTVAHTLGYTYVMRLDQQTTANLTGVSCVAATTGNAATCTAPVPAALNTLINGFVAGQKHTLDLLVSNGIADAQSDPLSANVPGKPGSFTITVTLTFTP